MPGDRPRARLDPALGDGRHDDRPPTPPSWRRASRPLLAELSPDETAEDWFATREQRWIFGTPDQARAKIAEFAAAGVERLMLQDFLPRDLEMIDAARRGAHRPLTRSPRCRDGPDQPSARDAASW